jgi:hypothetical protein
LRERGKEKNMHGAYKYNQIRLHSSPTISPILPESFENTRRKHARYLLKTLEENMQDTVKHSKKTCKIPPKP